MESLGSRSDCGERCDQPSSRNRRVWQWKINRLDPGIAAVIRGASHNTSLAKELDCRLTPLLRIAFTRHRHRQWRSSAHTVASFYPCQRVRLAMLSRVLNVRESFKRHCQLPPARIRTHFAAKMPILTFENSPATRLLQAYVEFCWADLVFTNSYSGSIPRPSLCSQFG